MRPTVPFEVMLAAKAIQEAGDQYTHSLKIGLPDGRGGWRTLVCADVVADWIVANCDGLPDTTPEPVLRDVGEGIDGGGCIVKPWREVLAERGWTIKPYSSGGAEAYAPMNEDSQIWCVTICQLRSGWSASIDVDESNLIFWPKAFDTEDAAFAALMAKPIGPGRVTVGVLLGLALPAGGG